MQRPQGQHDDLARLSGTRSDQSGDRRSPAARDRRRPSLRLPGRVVASVPDPRPSKSLASNLLHANRSLSDTNRVSGRGIDRAPGNGFRALETQGAKLTPSTLPSRQTPPALYLNPRKP